MNLIQIARALIIIGMVFVLAGGILYLAVRSGIPLGRLPGDIRVERDNLTCFFPIATSILLSIVLTLILNIAARILNK